MSYPERQAAPMGGADRLLAGIGFRFHNIVARRLGSDASLAARVQGDAARLRGQELPGMLPALRYRLRRHGFLPALLHECFALYAAAMPEREAARLSPPVLAAARWLVMGGVVELADADERAQALGLAAFVRAAQGAAVHLLAAHDSAAQALAGGMRDAFAALGLDVGCVVQAMDAQARRKAYACAAVCVAHREVALDYLRDRVQSGGRPGALRGRLERMSGGAMQPEPLLLNGLHCALVLDADRVMLDDARAPLMIAREVDQSQERLMYEQAIELAHALQPEADFHVEEGGLRLTDAAAGLLGRLVTPLGGVWAARERREELVRLALEVLHVLQRDVDYRVDNGRVLLPERPPEEAEARAAQDAVLRMLIEVKEGCRTSPRREVVARVSLPAFLTRYLHLGGACVDARGLEREFWALYRLKTGLAGPRGPVAALTVRVFVTGAAKRAALARALQGAAGAGNATLVALRTPGEAKALQEVVAAAGAGVTVYPGQASVPALDAERPLALFVAELHDAHRHIDALCAAFRATAAEVLVALEDERMDAALNATLLAAARRFAAADGELAPWMARLVFRLAQRATERSQMLMRSELLSRDQYMNDLLAFAGEGD